VLGDDPENGVQVSFVGQATQKPFRAISLSGEDVDSRDFILLFLLFIQFNDSFVGGQQFVDIFVADEQNLDVFVEAGTDLQLAVDLAVQFEGGFLLLRQLLLTLVSESIR